MKHHVQQKLEYDTLRGVQFTELNSAPSLKVNDELIEFVNPFVVCSCSYCLKFDDKSKLKSTRFSKFKKNVFYSVHLKQNGSMKMIKMYSQNNLNIKKWFVQKKKQNSKFNQKKSVL